MAAEENCFAAELTEDEVTKLLENAAKFNGKCLQMYNKCNWTSTKGSLKQFTGRSKNQHKSAQIRSNWMKTHLHYKFNSVLLPRISKRLVTCNSSLTKLLKSAQ